ncbi:MAG TPA: hypothetical protein VIY51_01010, partial [Xanthobacteraceae bacterium]
MSDQTKSHSKESRCTLPGASRRVFLKSSAALAAGATVLPGRALAQGAGANDADLARVQGRRRVLLKGGVVLTLDPRVGDF